MIDSPPKVYLTTLVLLLGLVLLSVYLFRSLHIQQQKLINIQENRYNSYLLTTQLRRSSDDLTRLVRTYASTGNPKFEKQFFEVLAIRNGESALPLHYDRVYWDFLAIDKGIPPYTLGKSISLQSLMKGKGFTEDEFLLLDKAKKNSDNLVNLERVSMNAMKGKYIDENGEYSVTGTPDPRMAIDILHSNEYHNAKLSIMRPINQFYEKLDQRTKEQVAHAVKKHHSIFIIQIVTFTLTVIGISLLIAIAKQYHKNMVLRLNKLVDDRTDQLNISNQELQKVLSEIKLLKEKEKRVVFDATVKSTQHILNNLLNQMQYFKLVADETNAFDDEVNDIYKNTIKEGKELVINLSSVEELTAENIIGSVYPKNGT